MGAGGPSPFTFTVSTNATWLKLTPGSGSVSPTNPEVRVEATVDWDSLPTGQSFASLSFNAVAKGQPPAAVPAFFVATKNAAPTGFNGEYLLILILLYVQLHIDYTGFIEGDGGISIEAAHTSRNTSVAGITWTELPGYGKTVSGITPWPRTENNFGNFSLGQGPSVSVYCH